MMDRPEVRFNFTICLGIAQIFTNLPKGSKQKLQKYMYFTSSWVIRFF